MTSARIATSEPIALVITVPLMFVTEIIMLVGTPTGPNGVGGVLATRHTTAAVRGLNPRPISIAAATATGAPSPDTPSRKAEKQKAMSSACRRRSPESEEMELSIVPDSPPPTVRLKKKTAVRMIHPIGQSPLIIPSTAADPAAR